MSTNVIAALDFGAKFGQFGIDWHLLVVQTLNFILVATILYKFGIKNVMKVMDSRKETIESGLKYADQMKKEMEAFENARETRNRQAQSEAATIVQSAKDDAKSIIDKGKAESKQLADGMLENAQQEITREREQVILEAKSEIGELVAGIAERLLQSKMTATQRNAYVAAAGKIILEGNLVK